MTWTRNQVLALCRHWATSSHCVCWMRVMRHCEVHMFICLNWCKYHSSSGSKVVSVSLPWMCGPLLHQNMRLVCLRMILLFCSFSNGTQLHAGFLRLRTTSWTAHAAVQPFVALDEWSTLFRCLSAELCDINRAYDEWRSEWGHYSEWSVSSLPKFQTWRFR